MVQKRSNRGKIGDFFWGRVTLKFDWSWKTLHLLCVIDYCTDNQEFTVIENQNATYAYKGNNLMRLIRNLLFPANNFVTKKQKIIER